MTTHTIGLNAGYGWTKAFSGHASTLFESCIAPAVALQFTNPEDLLIGGNGGLQLTINGQSWFAGGLARLHSKIVIEPRARKRSADVTRILALTALYKLGVRDGDTVNLVTGLPVRWYRQDKDIISALLTGPHTLVVNDQRHAFDIANVVVVPEAFGTYYRILVNEHGVLTDAEGLRNVHVGIIDVGTYTTNYIHIAPGPRYAEDGSSSIPIGMSRAYELLQSTIYERTGRELTFRETEALLQEDTPTVRRGAEHIPVYDLVNTARSAVAEAVLSQGQTLWGTGDSFELIIATGGGSLALSSAIIARYPHTIPVPDPQMANAEGFYRYALRRFAPIAVAT